GALEMVGLDTITENLTASNGVKRVENDFSLDLQAGENITVTGNTISATIPEQHVYTGGTGIEVVDTTINNTMEIVAGLGILVTAIPGGYEISSESLKTERKDNEDDTTPDNANDTLTDVQPPETVETTSTIPDIFPPPLVGFPIIPVPPVVPAAIVMPLPTLLGGLSAASSLFGSVFGYQREREKNSDGSYTLDSGGNYTWTDGSNTAIVSDKTSRLTRLLMDDWPEDVTGG
ncbi:hypothetical protein HDU87_003879, partial [Geranomyces variabilis]